MEFDVKVIKDCFKLSKRQIRELLITIILPVAAGVALIAPLWPSLIKDGRTLNICLLGFVAALPMVLINNVIWALSYCAFLERVIRIVAISFFLSSPGLKKNEVARDRARTVLGEMFDEVSPFDDVKVEAIRSFDFRGIASVLTAIEFYLTAIIVCLFTPGILISALSFLVIALLPPIGAMVVINKISSELQSKLSEMTHREIIEHVSQFVRYHFSSYTVERLRSGLYVVLDGDRNVSLSEILDTRMQMVDSVWPEAKEIHEGEHDEKAE